jgi:hypothetical protein
MLSQTLGRTRDNFRGGGGNGFDSGLIRPMRHLHVSGYLMVEG